MSARACEHNTLRPYPRGGTVASAVPCPPRRAYGLVIPHSVLRPRRPAQSQDSLQIGETRVLPPGSAASPASIDDLEAMCGLHACDLGDSVLLRILRPRL